jgi:hypothetical protein
MKLILNNLNFISKYIRAVLLFAEDVMEAITKIRITPTGTPIINMILQRLNQSAIFNKRFL